MSLRSLVAGKPTITSEADRKANHDRLEELNKDIKGENFKDEDLSGLDLSGLTFDGTYLDSCLFHGTNLSMVIFIEARLERAEFFDIDFKSCRFVRSNLANFRLENPANLAPHIFSGCDLTNAKLPEEFFAPLIKVTNNLSSSLKSKSLGVVTSSAVVALTAYQLNDLEVFTNAGALQIPFLPVVANCTVFFILAPLILFWVYLYFHIILSRFLDATLKLPLVFPNGLFAEQVCEPSIFFGLIDNGGNPGGTQGKTFLVKSEHLIRCLYMYFQFFFLIPAAIAIVLHQTKLAQSLVQYLCYTLLILSFFFSLGKLIWIQRRYSTPLPRFCPFILLCCFLGITLFHQLTESHSLKVEKAEISVKLKSFKDDLPLQKQTMALAGKDFSKRSFANIMVVGSFLPLSDFSHSILRNAHFLSSDLLECNFEHAKMDGADFKATCLDGSAFFKATLNNANFDTDLTRVSFEEAELKGVDFHGRIISNSNFKGADLLNANLNHVTFCEVQYLTDALNFPPIVKEACFIKADLVKWKLKGPPIDFLKRGYIKNLEFCFRDTNFSFATINANETEIIDYGFDHCNFSNADISSAHFLRCAFNQCNMTVASANGTSFVGSHFYNCDFSSTMITRANFSDCKFTSGEFAGTDFSGCIFKNTTFINVNLDKSIITEEQLKSCIIIKANSRRP